MNGTSVVWLAGIALGVAGGLGRFGPGPPCLAVQSGTEDFPWGRQLHVEGKAMANTWEGAFPIGFRTVADAISGGPTHTP